MIVPFTGAPRSPSANRPSDENLLMAAAVMHEQGRLIIPKPSTESAPDPDETLATASSPNMSVNA